VVLSYFFVCYPDDVGSECNLETDQTKMQFFNVRMPPWYNYIDICMGVIYSLEYCVKLFISQNRCSYFITLDSLIDLLIIIPTFLEYNVAQVGLFFQSSSRLLRIVKATNVLKK